MIEFDLSFSDDYLCLMFLVKCCLTQRELIGKKFEEICSQVISLILNHLDKCNNKDSFDGIVDFITLVIFHASTISMPVKRSGMRNMPWWSLEIS